MTIDQVEISNAIKWLRMRRGYDYEAGQKFATMLEALRAALAAAPSRSLAGTTPEMQKMYDEFGGERSFELKFSEQELTAIQELAEWHQISQQQALKQALRTYQLHEKRIRDGETFAWSGDKTRAEEFAALAATPAVGGEVQTIPWKDSARQFPLYELAPDFTLQDRDPQADERLKLYRDIFAEITAKAKPVMDPTSDDPERVRHYILPVGPLHRAAGKLGFQLFDGEQHLADAVKEIERLKTAQPASTLRGREPLRETIKQILVDMIQRKSHVAIVDYETTIDYILTAFSAAPPEQPTTKLACSEPLGPLYDGTTMDNQKQDAGPGGGMTSPDPEQPAAGDK